MPLQIGQKVAIVKRQTPKDPFTTQGEGWVVGLGTKFAYVNCDSSNVLCSKKEAHPYSSANSRLVAV